MNKLLVIIAVVALGMWGSVVYRSADDARTAVDSPAAVPENESGPKVQATEEVKAPAEKTVDLSGQQLTKTPSYVFEERDATSLDLSDNNLTGALQAEVRNLSKLQLLDLSDNNFTGVPAEIGQLSELRKLDLSNNKLTGLPHELGNLTSLQVLDLRGNTPSAYDLEIIRSALRNTAILVD